MYIGTYGMWLKASNFDSFSLAILIPMAGRTEDCLFSSLPIFSYSNRLICWKPSRRSDAVEPCDPRPSLSSCTITFSRQSPSFLGTCQKHVGFLLLTLFSKIFWSPVFLHHPFIGLIYCPTHTISTLLNLFTPKASIRDSRSLPVIWLLQPYIAIILGILSLSHSPIFVGSEILQFLQILDKEAFAERPFAKSSTVLTIT